MTAESDLAAAHAELQRHEDERWQRIIARVMDLPEGSAKRGAVGQLVIQARLRAKR